MPDLNFVLPHWLYWLGLVAFPLLAMVMVRRHRARARRPAGASLPLGYMLLVTAGFVGVHRFYLRSWLGVIYLPLFIAILYANGQTRDAREARSLANSDVMIADFDLGRAQDAVDKLEDGAQAKLAAALQTVDAAQAGVARARDAFDNASAMARWCAIAIAALLLIDAVMLPRLVRRADERAPPEKAEPPEQTAAEEPDLKTVNPITRGIEAVSRFSGEFVAYWSVIAVFAYYYEVVARYIFNSPTNWAHEGMFLMFGMQYLMSGAYAYMSDSHVRVDVFYARFSARGKAFTDLLTSVFFFIFAGTLLWTGWIFFMDSAGVMEVSFTEWAIQYWPVKGTIVLGAALIILQGVAKLLKDIEVLATAGRA